MKNLLMLITLGWSSVNGAFKRSLCSFLGHKGWIGKMGKPIRCKRCGALWALTK